MKGMTNNQIIMNEAAKLDPATLHAIATAHHTPEQIAAIRSVLRCNLRVHWHPSCQCHHALVLCTRSSS